MSLALHAYVRIKRRRVQRFLANAERADAIQREVLLSKIRRQAASDFGKRHHFGNIRTLADFRRHLPITNYEYYRDDIERVKNGEVHAMFGPGTRLLMFARTTGSTAKSKYVPITQELFDQYRAGWNLWGVQTYADHIDLVRKKTLQLASNWQQFFTPGGTPCGNISGLVSATAPPIARSLFVAPKLVTTLDSARARHYLTLRFALPCRRLGMIGTANPSTLVELARFADRHRESLIRDIHDGTLTAKFEVPDEVRVKLGRRISRRDVGRAQELEKFVEQHGALRPQDAWPQLSVLAVWLGGSVGVYLPHLKPWYGEPALRDHGLSASEGRMTVPLADGTTAGVLEYNHHFFEFVPVEEHGSEHPTVLEAHELEEGKDYFILLTTSGGFYRYDIHDVVRCIGFEGRAPMLVFLNKGANFSSFTGEKLSEYQVVTAVQQAFQDMAMTAPPFTLAPVMDQRLGYVLLFEAGAVSQSDDRLAQRVDEILQNVNWEYAEKRKSGRLLPIRIRQVPRGTWFARRLHRTSELGNFEHYKHPCLVNDLHFANDLAKLPTMRSV